MASVKVGSEITNMTEKCFGFGIVGAGVIAHFHARAIAAIPNAHLLGVFSHNKGKADEFAFHHNCHAHETLEEMLLNPCMDIVCICTPSGVHLEPALICMEYGKHCLIEKPLEITLERCDRIISAANKSKLKVGVVFPSRFYEVNKQVKQSIQGNRFGSLVLGDAYLKWNRSPEYYKSGNWRGTWQYDGGGALMNQGIHSVDLLQWFMGPVSTVQAVAANLRHMDIEVEDTAVAVLKFANGALGTIECSTAVFPGSFKRIEILGTCGTAVVEENSMLKWQFAKEMKSDETIKDNFCTENSSPGGSNDPSAISFTGHQKQIEDMIFAVERDNKVLIDAAEGRKSVEIVLAVYESAGTGKKVQLTA